MIAYLLVPIAVMILYSFNGSNAHLPTVTFKLQGFTTQWYREWNKVPGLTPAFYLSLRLAFASAITAAVLGTLLALARYRFRGKGMTEQILFLNIAAPKIVPGAALLGFFITLAAQDLGASAWVTFRKITLPLIFPAVLAGALLAFALSIDDFVTSNFVSGTTATFPLWVWGAVKVGIPPQVFVLGTMIFVVGIGFAVLNLVWQARKDRVARVTR